MGLRRMKKDRPVQHEGNQLDKLEAKHFLEHLEDLRRMIIKALLVFGCVFLFCIPLTIKGYTIRLLKHPLLSALSRLAKDASAAPLPTLSPPGGFAAAMLTFFISTNNTAMHAWGSIFIQDVVCVLRKKPLSQKQHMWYLRMSIVFVAVFPALSG